MGGGRVGGAGCLCGELPVRFFPFHVFSPWMVWGVKADGGGRYVYLVSIAFGAVSIVAACFLGNIDRFMDDHVAVLM